MSGERLRLLIKRHEGLRLKSYLDSQGVLTVGYGHSLANASGPIPDEISPAEAEELFEKDLAYAVHMCELFVRGYDRLDEVRQGVLVDMCFNMGVGGLLTFRNTLPLIEAGRYGEAAEHMLASKWAGQVGGRAVEDAAMMRTGQWPEWLAASVPDEPEPQSQPIPAVRRPSWGIAALAAIRRLPRFFSRHGQ